MDLDRGRKCFIFHGDRFAYFDNISRELNKQVGIKYMLRIPVDLNRLQKI